MPETLKKRAAIWKVLVAILRKGHKTHLSGPMGSDVPLMLTFGGVVIQTADGKPRTATKVGALLEIPRETVRRYLDQLVSLELLQKVGKEYELAPTVNARHLDELLRYIKICISDL